MLSDETRASDRVSIAFTSLRQFLIAPSVLRHALQTIYTAKARRRNREDQTPLLYPVSTEKTEPASVRAHYSISQESDVARDLSYGRQRVPFYRYENLAKIKNRRLSPPSSDTAVAAAAAVTLRHLRYRDAEQPKERVEKRRANMCASTPCARKEGGKVGYDMSGMLYDPIFQKITFCASLPPPSPPLPAQRLALIPLLVCSLFYRQSLSLSLSPP